MILCRRNAAGARERMEAIMAKLKLTVNPQKTRVCRVPEETFEFLGYALGRCYSTRTGRAYIGTRPSKKRVRRLCEEISLLTRRATVGQEARELVGAINARLRGWANYFSLGPVSKAYRAVDSHTRYRLRRWLSISIRSKDKSFPVEHLYQRLGLLRLEALTVNLPWAKA